MAHPGWEYTSSGFANIEDLFSEKMIDEISTQITDALVGVDPQGRKIRLSNERILEVLSNVYQNATTPNIGDIHTRYIIPQEQPRNDPREIVNQTINLIVNAIKTQVEVTENNKQLTIWNSLYGDFNEKGLRAHAPIKIRRRHPQYMAFNMNY
ncbi:MAG: hypothetical protein EBV19_05150 [Flavobacteriia bacterium]|nr:hypothetical protein [Flavobacteriia bacterium]